MPAGEIYDKSGEKLLILNTRTAHVYPFEVLNWLDLRVGFFLSLTDVTDDDDPTGLAETMGLTGVVPNNNRVWIGVKARRDAQLFPGTFIGFTNFSPTGRGDSVLASSDIGVGTTDANYWRPKNASDPIALFGMFDGGNFRRGSVQGIEQHFVQDPTGAGGYAGMLGIRLRRQTTTSRLITATVQTDGAHSGDMLYSNTPSEAVLRGAMESWPSQVQTIGPVELTNVPDALYWYWPFRNSRLRIHSCAVLKAS